jgi:hypothetical protein
VALRIGFDMDGVFADMEAELLRQATLIFGEPMKRRLAERREPDVTTPDAEPADAPGDHVSARQAAAEAAPDNVPSTMKVGMTARQQRRLWRHVESIDDFWQTLRELEPGVIKRLAALALERRWEIIFLTKRPETAGATAQVQSQRWLESKGFSLPSVFVVQGSRGRIAAALGLDIVVDDRPENCLDVAIDSTARAILVWRDDAGNVPGSARQLGIGSVGSMSECLDILESLDRPDSAQLGMVERLKRLLGLKPQAARLKPAGRTATPPSTTATRSVS